MGCLSKPLLSACGRLLCLQKLIIKALLTWGQFSALDQPSSGCGRHFVKEDTQMHPSHNPKAALQVREALERQTLANDSLSK